MALLDLSLVTRSLINLLTQTFVPPVWPSASPPTISPQPPDTLHAEGLSLYLYYLSEDSHFKNAPAPTSDVPPIRYTPMGLNLYYQLTAHSATDSDEGAYLQQYMMGIAVKALRDYPVIDDSTQINGTTIFPAALRGTDNRFRIVLQPLPHNEAISYWTAGTSPIRLAAYYQVSVVLLEPEETQSRAGRVLTYGVHTFIEGAPRLDTSQNTLSFTIPGESNPREVELRPAQVPVGGRVTFTGFGLTGDNTSLFLRNRRWTQPVEADLAWTIAARSDRISAVVQQTASGQDVLPGIYSAFVRVTRRRTLPDGTVRNFEHDSNECPFAITPRIDSISAPDASGVVTVQGYIFRYPNPLPVPPPDPPLVVIQVYLGENLLVEGTAGSLNPGEFAVVDPPAPPPVVLPTLQFRLPAGLASGQVIPLRIFVNGAESPPNWISIP